MSDPTKPQYAEVVPILLLLALGPSRLLDSEKAEGGFDSIVSTDSLVTVKLGLFSRSLTHP
jgi:hypothetical protein